MTMTMTMRMHRSRSKKVRVIFAQKGMQTGLKIVFALAVLASITGTGASTVMKTPIPFTLFAKPPQIDANGKVIKFDPNFDDINANCNVDYKVGTGTTTKFAVIQTNDAEDDHDDDENEGVEKSRRQSSRTIFCETDVFAIRDDPAAPDTYMEIYTKIIVDSCSNEDNKKIIYLDTAYACFDSDCSICEDGIQNENNNGSNNENEDVKELAGEGGYLNLTSYQPNPTPSKDDCFGFCYVALKAFNRNITFSNFTGSTATANNTTADNTTELMFASLLNTTTSGSTTSTASSIQVPLLLFQSLPTESQHKLLENSTYYCSYQKFDSGADETAVNQYWKIIDDHVCSSTQSSSTATTISPPPSDVETSTPSPQTLVDDGTSNDGINDVEESALQSSSLLSTTRAAATTVINIGLLILLCVCFD